jgi:hypothetical protein
VHEFLHLYAGRLAQRVDTDEKVLNENGRTTIRRVITGYLSRKLESSPETSRKNYQKEHTGHLSSCDRFDFCCTVSFEVDPAITPWIKTQQPRYPINKPTATSIVVSV